jgi:glutamate/aspartate transport system substrate-binding protein
MKKSIWVSAAVLAAAVGATGAAQAQDTLKKIKDSGSITMGVRESSGALAFTLGDGKYTGFHYDVCQHIIADLQKQLGMAKIDVKYQPVTSQNRIPLVQNGTVDLDAAHHQQRRGRRTCRSRRRSTSRRCASPQEGSGIKASPTSMARPSPPPPVRPRSAAAKNKRAAGMGFKGSAAGPLDSFHSNRPADAFVMDGQILAGLISSRRARATTRSSASALEPIAIMYRKDDGVPKAVDDSVRNIARAARRPTLISGSYGRSRRATPRSACRLPTPQSAWASRTTSRRKATRKVIRPDTR